MPGGLTPNAVLVRRALVLVGLALAGLVGLALLSRAFGNAFVLAIEAANTAQRAELLDRDGRYASAMSEYYRLLEIRPDDTAIRASLVELLLRRGDAAEALVQAERLVGQASSTDRARNLSLYGDALAANGDAQAARAAYREALESAPEFADALYGMAVQAAAAGRLSEARGYFARLRDGRGRASNLYARGIRNGEAIDQRLGKMAGKWRLSRAETAAVIEWHLKHGRVERALEIYAASPRWEPAKHERGVVAAAALERGES